MFTQRHNEITAQLINQAASSNKNVPEARGIRLCNIVLLRKRKDRREMMIHELNASL